MKYHERGVSVIGFLLVAAILAGAGVLAAQAVPTVIEFQSITKAATKAAEGGTVAEVRSIFDKVASIDDIKSISGKDLTVSKQGNKTVVAFSYTREIHIAGPAYLLLKYDGQSK
jgi:hypothetical protein